MRLSPRETGPRQHHLLRRLLWFGAIWLASVAALALVANGIRWLVR